ncbi:peptidoglycan recognition protein family protein [Allostreptomyces psammosilenae]|uniref:Peptidoglycan recognition protein family domain-containing protein n=1 Tax=Allostreptomyces psammosilenae TaxID=1892865 RepID=A0A852ZSP2_9ACTN|nr:N-acetylmuramoyl-L-alanine amidase [Allostreptomyces psammosilenae]NYI04280.1 hypothetical protein [Allostreptomyces psammosilenae]
MRATTSTVVGLGCAVVLAALPQAIANPPHRPDPEPAASAGRGDRPSDGPRGTRGGDDPGGAGGVAPAAPGTVPEGGIMYAVPLTASEENPDTTSRLPATLTPAAPGRPASLTLDRLDMDPFSLVGVTWEEPTAALHATVEVRVRDMETQEWGEWQPLEIHPDDAPDAPSDEGGDRVRGGTAPLWVGASDGVEVRMVQVEPEGGDGHQDAGRDGAASAAAPAAEQPFPAGLRLDLVNPGDLPVESPGKESSGGGGTIVVNTPGRPADTGPAALPAVLPAVAGPAPAAGAAVVAAPVVATTATAPAGEPEPRPGGALAGTDWQTWLGGAGGAAGAGAAGEGAAGGAGAGGQAAGGTPPGSPDLRAPRPEIVTRAQWGADESVRDSAFAYTATVKAAFVHHTGSGNDYSCADAPALIKSIYLYHVTGNGWRDIGYNFLVDKCGTIYEGRAGGITEAILGAHTTGFNIDTIGVAVLGTFTDVAPSEEALRGLERIIAWKLGLFGRDAAGTTTLVSSNSDSRYAEDTPGDFAVVSGHQDGFHTDCPGRMLQALLPRVREGARALQGGGPPVEGGA